MSSLSAAATVLVVAPPTLQRQGLLATLREARPDLAVSATADTQALPDRMRRHSPVLLILDASFPGAQSTEIIELLRSLCPTQRMLILGGKRLAFNISRLIVEMGGGMRLTRRATPSDLVAAVAQLIGDAPASEVTGVQEPTFSYTRRAPQPEPLALFSPRELEVLKLVADGCTSQKIADLLFISPRTVEAHRRMLLEKAGTRSMIGLVLQAVRSGWVTVE